MLETEIHNNRLINRHHLWNWRNINSWFLSMTSANVRNNCTVYNNVKRVRSVDANKNKGSLLLCILFSYTYSYLQTYNGDIGLVRVSLVKTIVSVASVDTGVLDFTSVHTQRVIRRIDTNMAVTSGVDRSAISAPFHRQSRHFGRVRADVTFEPEVIAGFDRLTGRTAGYDGRLWNYSEVRYKEHQLLFAGFELWKMN